jgi:hypothetical protein
MYHRNRFILFLQLLLTMTVSLSACFSSDESTPAENNRDSAASAPTNTPAPTAADPATANAGPEQISVVEDTTAINSYRMRIEIHSEDARGNNDVAIEGEFVKQPPAERLVIRFEENGEPQQMEMLVVDGLRYVQAEGMWMQAPDLTLNIAEYTLITPADIAEESTGLTRLGSETVNGRTTVHYQGDKSSIPVAGTASDTFDVSQVESAQLDLWVDEAENFIVKLQIKVQDGQGEQGQRHTLLIEYLDFNIPITIKAPENLASELSTDASSDQPAAVTEPRTDLGKLLGFDILLLLMYQQGAKIVTINLTALAANETRMEVVTTP